MYDSLREILSPKGLKVLLSEMSTNYKARLATEEESTTASDDNKPDLPPHRQALFLATLRRFYPNEATFGN